MTQCKHGSHRTFFFKMLSFLSWKIWRFPISVANKRRVRHLPISAFCSYLHSVPSFVLSPSTNYSDLKESTFVMYNTVNCSLSVADSRIYTFSLVPTQCIMLLCKHFSAIQGMSSAAHLIVSVLTWMLNGNWDPLLRTVWKGRGGLFWI